MASSAKKKTPLQTAEDFVRTVQSQKKGMTRQESDLGAIPALGARMSFSQDSSSRSKAALKWAVAIRKTVRITQLRDRTVAELLKSKKQRGIVEVHENTSVQECLAVLQRKHLVAVAVYSCGDPDDDEGKREIAAAKRGEDVYKQYVGIITMFDIMNYVVFEGRSATAPLNKAQLDAIAKQRFSEPVSDLLALTKEASQSGLYLFATDKIGPLTELFSEGIHRVLIATERQGKWPTYSLITHSDLVRFLYTHADEELHGVVQGMVRQFAAINQRVRRGLARQKTVNEFKVATSKVITVRASEPAINALSKIRESVVDAIAVVDQYGCLLHEFSGYDLRGLDLAKLSLLVLPVPEFLKAVSKGGDVKPPVTCEPEDNIDDVIGKALRISTHRVWVVEDGAPVSVINLNDIIIEFSKLLTDAPEDLEGL